MTTPVTMEALQTLRRPVEAAISPDGSQIACSVLTAACTDPPHGQRADLWLVRPGGQPRQLTRGPWLDSIPRWSPDGQRLAFASDRDHPGLLAAYLLARGHRFEVILPNAFISGDDELRAILAPLWQKTEMQNVETQGGSFWLQMN